MAQCIVYERESGSWGWHLEADNGQIIATGGNLRYENLSQAQAMALGIVGGVFAEAELRVTRKP